MTYTIEEYRIEDLGDKALGPIVDLVNVFAEERELRYVPMTIDEFRVFAESPGYLRRRWVARDEQGHPFALANTGYSDDGSSPEILRAQVAVVAEKRRRGLGSSLLALAAEQATEMGRRRLSGAVFDTTPGAMAFARSVGSELTMEFQVNTLRLENLDLGLMQTWLESGPVRASGYTLRIIEGLLPQEFLPGMAHLYHVLERDMPTPESWEPREWTAELVGEMQAHFGRGSESLSALTIHEDSGELAGMSQLVRRRSDPTTWHVTTTMVDPSHRGHALGKWVKAAVALEAMNTWPDGKWMETGNAHTNEAMLGINREMGFEHEYTMSDVEADVEAVRAYLDRRGAGDVQ